MSDKTPYILKTSPEMIQADPEVIARLQAFVDYHLSIGGDIYHAWEAQHERHCSGRSGSPGGSAGESGAE